MDNKWHKWFHRKYWSTRYKKSKKAVKYVLIMKELLEKGKHFSRVSHPQPPPDFIPFPSEDYVTGFGSMDVVLDQVMQALNGQDTRTIGVYGIGGVGKTTLLKRLNNEISRNNIFEKIIMVTISRTFDLRRIQSEIAQRIRLKLDSESSTQERADMLSRRLKTEKRVFLMLDNTLYVDNLVDLTRSPYTRCYQFNQEFGTVGPYKGE
ncbi:hypothetical protein Sjap_003303 [Stephania japonica]|uniref:NB-ARC domain-containing protein n=1 Tax=Stephania japonica TaxID=461633 RepID=A0AAP0KQ32_9MAGN